jgi:hypothetical protein
MADRREVAGAVDGGLRIELATSSAAIVDPAPGLFSTTNGWPSSLAIGSAMIRVTTSMASMTPPGP